MEAGGIHLNFTDIKQKSLTQNCGKYDKNRKSKRSEALILEEKQKKKSPPKKEDSCGFHSGNKAANVDSEYVDS